MFTVMRKVNFVNGREEAREVGQTIFTSVYALKNSTQSTNQRAIVLITVRIHINTHIHRCIFSFNIEVKDFFCHSWCFLV